MEWRKDNYTRDKHPHTHTHTFRLACVHQLSSLQMSNAVAAVGLGHHLGGTHNPAGEVDVHYVAAFGVHDLVGEIGGRLGDIII